MFFFVIIMILIFFFLNFFLEFLGVGFGKFICYESNFFIYCIINCIFFLFLVYLNFGIIMLVCFIFSGDDFVRKFIFFVD